MVCHDESCFINLSTVHQVKDGIIVPRPAVPTEIGILEGERDTPEQVGMQQTGVVKYMYSEAEIENMKLKDIKPVLKMYGVSVNKPVKELRLLLKSLECETMEEKMLKRKLTFFKRYKNSGFSNPVKRYKTSFNTSPTSGGTPVLQMHGFCGLSMWLWCFLMVVGIPLVKTLVEGENIPSGPIMGIA